MTTVLPLRLYTNNYIIFIILSFWTPISSVDKSCNRSSSSIFIDNLMIYKRFMFVSQTLNIIQIHTVWSNEVTIKEYISIDLH